MSLNPPVVGLLVFCCIFGGALIGMFLRGVLPEHHLSAETKDVVKLAMGLIGTMTALLLGLLVASTKAAYDARNSELIHMSANFVLLDRVLAHYGPETHPEREQLRGSVSRLIAGVWSKGGNDATKLDPSSTGSEIIYDQIQQLTPQNDAERGLKNEALTLAVSLGQTRWLLFEQSGSSISMPFLMVMVFWLSIIFASFGLFAPRNMTVVVSLLLAAASVSGAIFLILELDQPFAGIIQISSAPLRSALMHLGK
jgi:hypothetical protein